MRKRMTVKEAVTEFFEGTISEELLYREIKNGNIPHVRISKGKTLLDVQQLEIWWQQKLMESVQLAEDEQPKEYGKLRRIAE